MDMTKMEESDILVQTDDEDTIEYDIEVVSSSSSGSFQIEQIERVEIVHEHCMKSSKYLSEVANEVAESVKSIATNKEQYSGDELQNEIEENIRNSNSNKDGHLKQNLEIPREQAQSQKEHVEEQLEVITVDGSRVRIEGLEKTSVDKEDCLQEAVIYDEAQNVTSAQTTFEPFEERSALDQEHHSGSTLDGKESEERSSMEIDQLVYDRAHDRSTANHGNVPSRHDSKEEQPQQAGFDENNSQAISEQQSNEISDCATGESIGDPNLSKSVIDDDDIRIETCPSSTPSADLREVDLQTSDCLGDYPIQVESPMQDAFSDERDYSLQDYDDNVINPVQQVTCEHEEQETCTNSDLCLNEQLAQNSMAVQEDGQKSDEVAVNCVSVCSDRKLECMDQENHVEEVESAPLAKVDDAETRLIQIDVQEEKKLSSIDGERKLCDEEADNEMATKFFTGQANNNTNCEQLKMADISVEFSPPTVGMSLEQPSEDEQEDSLSEQLNTNDLMAPQTPPILIDDEDLEREFDEEPEFESREVSVKRNRDPRAEYKLADELGRGKFGTVYRCTELVSGRQLAAKFISMRRLEDRQDVEREVDIMCQLQHKRLLQLYDAFDDGANEMCLITELVEGGELFERIVDDDFDLTEKKAAIFMRQICEGVEYMHNKHIVHLDMKPENILCLSRTGIRIKLIDFGLARKLTPEQPLRVMFGTPDFAAPEVLTYEIVTFATDMWSVGVICYVLLSGLSPFMGENDLETMANVTKATFDFNYEAFEPITDLAKDFIARLLVSEPEKRLKPSECLKHAWLQRGGAPISQSLSASEVSSPAIQQSASFGNGFRSDNNQALSSISACLQSVAEETPQQRPRASFGGESTSSGLGISLDKRRLKRYVVRRKWHKTVHAIMALGRMGANLKM